MEYLFRKGSGKMALAKKCDMCGKFYDEYNFSKDDKNINRIMILNLDMNDYYYTNRPLDLFPSCKDSFKKWLNKKGEKNMSNMLDWAEREVAIACKKENPNKKDGEFDYGCACYESALKAFKSLCDDGHSGFSIKMTQEILNRLINGQPLTPIEDTDDVWHDVSDVSPNKYAYKLYQCKRMGSLFKYVYADGTVEYNENDRVYCININNPNNTYSSGLARRIIDSMFPITMPYMPGAPIKVYCEDFLTDKNNGDFDTVGVFYALKTENGKQEKIEINRFFREPKDNEERDWVEISKEEYIHRKNESECAGGEQDY